MAGIDKKRALLEYPSDTLRFYPLEEQRQNPRLRLRWHAALRLGQALLYGETFDLSLGGASLLMGQNIAGGTVATLFLQAPSRRPGVKGRVIEVQSKILYAAFAAEHDRWRLGVQFVRFAGEGKNILEKEMRAP